MNMNAVLDVVIGLILMYLLLGLICTIVNEFVSSVLKLRAANLRQGIENIVDDDRLLGGLLETGVIKAAGMASGRKGPSYLPSRTFAMGLLDALKPKDGIRVRRKMEDVIETIESLPESRIRSMLVALAEEAGDDLERFRTGVAAWFDDMMDRTSGIFKRKMKGLSLIVAGVLVVAVNADSVQVAEALWEDQTLRTQIAEAATELVEDTGLVDDLVDVKFINAELRPLPIGWDFDAPAWSTDWYRSFGGWIIKLFGLLFTAAAVSLGAPLWFDLLGKFTRIRASGPAPRRQVVPTQQA